MVVIVAVVVDGTAVIVVGAVTETTFPIFSHAR